MEAEPTLRILTPDEVQKVENDPVDPVAREQAKAIIDDIKANGVEALKATAVRLGDIEEAKKDEFVLTPAQLKEAFDALPADQQALLQRTHDRIKHFADAQMASLQPMETDIPDGRAGHKVDPVNVAGCYAPGGRYPLPSSVLMTAVTARAAGVPQVVVASPRPQPITLGAAHVARADLFLAVGGAQSIAAMAFGVGVPACDIIVGPGNKWVTAAKSLVAGTCGIDMLAGPSEVLVIADETADPDTIAADLLAQAEHDVDLPVKPKTKGSRLRDALFPIYGSHELKKFFTISMINFFIVFVLVITRDAKDTLVVTSCGAEAISFLKLYGVLPAATLFMLGYSKASIALSKPQLFYGTAAPFFLFYLLFDLAIYPLRGKLHPAPGTLRLPGGLAYLSKILENWTFALYYVVSEVYSAMSIGVLFWQHANDIVSVKQAKRFYPLFGQISSLAPILAGQCGVWLASKATFEQSLHYLTGLIGASGLAVGALYAYSLRLVARERAAAAAEGRELGLGVPPKKKKEKLGLLESLRVLSRSEYLGCLATLVVAYGLAINFSDILFKSVLKLKYPEKLDYQRFMGNFTTMVGVATFLVIFVGANVVKHLGWSAGALITPLTMAAVGLPFFGTICLGDRGSPAGLNFAVALGAAQTLLSKAAKFSFFDPTTQMAYIPLGEEEKVKGKAAIDGLGSRLGKSGGALAQQALVLVAGSVLGAAPAIAVIYYGVLLAWMGAVARLSKLFAAATAKREGEEAAAEEAAARSRGGVAAATGGGRP